jgi:hypothetical protein
VAGAPLLGRLPAGAGGLSRADFLDAARAGLGEASVNRLIRPESELTLS